MTNPKDQRSPEVEHLSKNGGYLAEIANKARQGKIRKVLLKNRHKKNLTNVYCKYSKE